MDHTNTKTRIVITNRINVRHRELEKSSSHEYIPEAHDFICAGCSRSVTPKSRPVNLRPQDTLTFAEDQATGDITITAQRRSSAGFVPLYFRLKSQQPTPGTNMFQVQSLACKIESPGTVESTVTLLLKELSPHHDVPLWSMTPRSTKTHGVQRNHSFTTAARTGFEIILMGTEL